MSKSSKQAAAAKQAATDRQESQRWYRLFQSSSDALFILNHQRRVLFVNTAWEQLTGFAFKQIHRHICKPSSAVSANAMDDLLAVFSPPADVLDDQMITVRRSRPGREKTLWEIRFFPFQRDGILRGLLGKVVPLTQSTESTYAPLPVRLLSLRDRMNGWHRLDQLTGMTATSRRTSEQMRLACRTGDPVWLSGEAGSGKQWAARTIHLHGPTRERCFIPVPCRHLPEQLLEAHLFGPGGVTRFSGVGTLYLQEPQFLPRELQARLHTWWLETQTWDDKPPIRLIVGSKLQPHSPNAVANLHDDFRCAFSILTIAVPPLRQRQDEFSSLTQNLLKRAAFSAGCEVADLTPEAMACLEAASWPGNLRELYCVLLQACSRVKVPTVGLNDLPLYLRNPLPQPPHSLPLDDLLEEAERRLLTLAMAWSKNNKTKAAETLGIWRERLIRRLKALGIK